MPFDEANKFDEPAKARSPGSGVQIQEAALPGKANSKHVELQLGKHVELGPCAVVATLVYHGATMLNLESDSSVRWLRQVQQHWDEVLIDHAHCEKKAAGTAMNLLFAYVDNEELCREMTLIVNEELEHFHMVLALLKQRRIPFRRTKPSAYGRKLNDLVRKSEPHRAVDRLLVAGLIEARSCERFGLLREHLPDRELADFYGSLFESEARHHGTYVRLARMYDRESAVRQRLTELAKLEAAIIAEGEDLPRMHS